MITAFYPYYFTFFHKWDHMGEEDSTWERDNLVGVVRKWGPTAMAPEENEGL